MAEIRAKSISIEAASLGAQKLALGRRRRQLIASQQQQRQAAALMVAPLRLARGRAERN
jgi:hypothetical protein